MSKNKRKVKVIMIYTENVKKKPDAILKAFENYIGGQNYFDYLDSYLQNYQECYSGGVES